MSVELVTGYYGVDEGGKPKRHVSSAEDGARQAGTVGLGCYALSTGSKLSATMEDANTLLVSDGDALINGRHVRIPDSLSFTIPTGVQGQKVSNIAVLRYQKAADSVESVTPVVLTGEPSTGTPTDPEHNEGSILDGDSPVDMPLYRVVTDGVNAGDPEPLFETVPPIAGLGFADLAGSVAASQLPVVPVSKGGTGATSADAARRALKAPSVGGEATDAVLSCDYDYDQRVKTQVIGPGGKFMTVAADDSFGLYNIDAKSWVWMLRPGKLLWSGSWSSGQVTIPGVNRYRVLAVSVSNYEDRLVGVNVGSGTVSLFANACWGNDSATDMAVLACRLTRSGSSETLEYNAGGRINLGNDFSYGYGVINAVYGVA